MNGLRKTGPHNLHNLSTMDFHLSVAQRVCFKGGNARIETTFKIFYNVLI